MGEITTMQENDDRLARAKEEGREAGKNKECFENNPYGPQYEAWSRGWKESDIPTPEDSDASPV